MDWMDFDKHWHALSGPLGQAFPNLGALDLNKTPVGTQEFVSTLAKAHDLTAAETSEIIDEIVLHALANGQADFLTDQTKVA